MLDSTAVVDLTAHLANLKNEGTSVVFCEHRTEPLCAIPGLRTIFLGDGGEACVHTEMPQDSFPACVVEPFVLELSGLTVRLGGREVLQGLDWKAESGQVVAIVGRNGAGKTTLLRALAGLQAYDGQVTVGGRSPDLRMVFQNPDLQLFNPSVRDEILYRIAEPDMARYEWLVQCLGLVDYQDTPPLLLSEGEKKRLALATVLMRGARHGVLLDEPALGQDRAHKLRLVHLMRALADAGQLVIMTTHDFSLARQADRIVVMGDGGFLADGCPEKVLGDESLWNRAGLVVPEWLDKVAL
jgi:energy-coupling factor transport system ATP-binding protein